MAFSEQSFFFPEPDFEFMLSIDETVLSDGIFDINDSEGDHYSVAANLMLGTVVWGVKCVPWNLCSSGGGGSIARRTGTYGHG